MIRNLLNSFLIATFTFSGAISAAQTIKIAEYEVASFSPSAGETFDIPIQIPVGEVLDELTVELRTQDNDTVTSLPIRLTGNQSYTLTWDGRDASGQVVPDEAYFPVIIAKNEGIEKIVLNSLENTGGEEVYDFEKNIEPKSIQYTLPAASRVLIRSGIHNGPMLKTVIDWEPRTAGFHAERWNGLDSDDLFSLEEHPDVGYLIIGYKLPNHAIITHGNKDKTYRQYRETKNWPFLQAPTRENILSRNDKIIRKEFYTPVMQQKSPRMSVELLESSSGQPTSSSRNFDELITKVTLNSQDEIYLDQERFEISFFVNNAFIAEEEQGFVPFTWRWSPGRLGLKPGKHILTVNVSGYNGQVAVKNLEFELEPTETP